MSEKMQEWIEAVEEMASHGKWFSGDAAQPSEYRAKVRANAARLTELAAYLRDGGAELDQLRRMTNPEVSDVEIEAALVQEGVVTWGPDGEIFERMFAKVMETRAAIEAAPPAALAMPGGGG